MIVWLIAAMFPLMQGQASPPNWSRVCEYIADFFVIVHFCEVQDETESSLGFASHLCSAFASLSPDFLGGNI